MNWNFVSVVIIYTFLLLISHILLHRQNGGRYSCDKINQAFKTKHDHSSAPRTRSTVSTPEGMSQENFQNSDDSENNNQKEDSCECNDKNKQKSETASSEVDTLNEVSDFDANAARAELESHLEDTIKPTNFFQEYSSTDFESSKIEDKFELPADFDMNLIQDNSVNLESSTCGDKNTSPAASEQQKKPSSTLPLPSSEDSPAQLSSTVTSSQDIEAYNNYDGYYADF